VTRAEFGSLTLTESLPPVSAHDLRATRAPAREYKVWSLMLGKTHALSGWCVGAGLAVAVHADPRTVVTFAGVTAVAAYFPDIDHPGSTISRCGGVVTEGISWLARFVSRRVYLATRTAKDRKSQGTHRYLCHSLPLFAVPVGLAVMVAAVFLHAPLWLGLAVGLGCFTHDIGDDLTEGLTPWLAPIKICGQRWRELPITPRWMRFKTGKWFEHIFVAPPLAVVAVLLIPGVWPVLLSAVHSHGHALPNGAS
jgi:membrane-bound metal-dependent hydrolase YbcI (DUF457 family)